MGYGWVSIHRQIQEHWLWKDKPFSYGQAWIDLILMANHTTNKFVLGSEIVTVPSGSFITSELKLAERWGWSKTKVRTFLTLLQNDSMIEKKSDHKKTTISIVNYSVFQESETTKKPQKDQCSTTEKPVQDTNNNDNNENNENKNIDISDSDESAPEPTPKKTKVVKHKYGEYNNVLLTDEEFEKLQNKYPDYQERIERLSSYVASTGKSYESHYATIRNWARKDAEKPKVTTTPKNGFHNFQQRNYDYDELEKQLLKRK